MYKNGYLRRGKKQGGMTIIAQKVKVILHKEIYKTLLRENKA